MGMKYNKGLSPVVVLLIVIGVLAVAGGVYFAGKKSAVTSTTVTQPAPIPTVPTPKSPAVSVAGVSHCGMTITAPAANASVSFPVNVSGVIDNTKASTLGCSWQMFEGQAGTAQLYYLGSAAGDWYTLNNPVVVPVSNWTSAGPVPFSVAVNFHDGGLGLLPGTKMKIVFTEENASGSGTVDTLTLPFTLH